MIRYNISQNKLIFKYSHYISQQVQQSLGRTVTQHGNRQWIFETFLSDYEQGVFKAMLEVFPGIGEEGCFFHLCKRLDFQVKELGLMPKYRQDDAFKLRVNKLAALAFIPVSDLVATFESLSTSFHNDELRLLAYFENTWIGQPVGGRRLPPLSPTTCVTSVTDQALDPHEQLMPLKLFTTPSNPS